MRAVRQAIFWCTFLLNLTVQAQGAAPDMEVVIDGEIRTNLERYKEGKDVYTYAEKLYLLRGGKNLCAYAKGDVKPWNLCMSELQSLANGNTYKKMDTLCKIAVPANGALQKQCVKEAKAMSETVAGYRARESASTKMSNLESAKVMSDLRHEIFEASNKFNNPTPPAGASVPGAQR